MNCVYIRQTGKGKKIMIFMVSTVHRSFTSCFLQNLNFVMKIIFMLICTFVQLYYVIVMIKKCSEDL